LGATSMGRLINERTVNADRRTAGYEKKKGDSVLGGAILTEENTVP